MQDAKYCQKFAIWAPSHNCLAISSQVRHVLAIGIVKQQYFPHNMSSQYGELRSTNGWDLLASLGTPANFNGFRVLIGSVTARHSSSGHQPNFAALNRGRRLYSAGRPSRWALAHILVLYWLVGLGHKFLDNGSQPSLNGWTRNFHTSLVWGQAWKHTCEIFLRHPKKIWRRKTSNSAELSPTRSQSPSA